MQLFKRILLSLFPDEIVNQTINPASMFVSFINAKQFFSVVNRKIVENYKLNLFDISLDPFEVKIWFGETPTIKVKDVDFYYGYAASANFNGYRFFSPSNIATSISLIAALYTRPAFKGKSEQLFLYFLFTIYLLTFLFQARLKVFPSTDDKENYSWFIDLFFSFYKVVLDQAWIEIGAMEMDALKQKLLQHIQVFFMLYYVYQSIGTCIQPHGISEKEFYGWLFYDELKKGDYQPLVKDWVDHSDEYAKSSSFNTTERKVMHLVLPADILLRYLLETEDIFLVTEIFSSHIYDKDKVNTYLRSFLISGAQLWDFLLYITDYNHFKKNYFVALKKYVIRTVKNQPLDNGAYEQDIDELLSTIGENTDMENIKIPQRLKKEAEIMERMMNFYVTFVGGYWIARWDTFYQRLCKKELMHLVSQELPQWIKQDALYYYGGLLYHYSKNVFYYKYAFENIRAGKDKFHLPFRATFREVYSNMFIIKLFDTHALATVLQDINPRDTKIYVKNKQIIELFKEYFSESISTMLHKKWESMIHQFYEPLRKCVPNIPGFIETIQSSLCASEKEYVKESLYTADVQIFHELLAQIDKGNISWHTKYSDYSILWILASLKDTLFGFILYYVYMLDQSEKSGNSYIAEDLFLKIYIIDVLNITEEYYSFFAGLITYLIEKWRPLWNLWIHLDDNKEYFQIGYENRKYFILNKTSEDIITGVVGEDIIRLRGYIKNIRYYNIRYVVPF